MHENTAIIVLCTIFGSVILLYVIYLVYQRIESERAEAEEGQLAFSKWIQHYGGSGSQRGGGGGRTESSSCDDSEGNFSVINPMMNRWNGGGGAAATDLDNIRSPHSDSPTKEASVIAEDSLKLKRAMDLHKLSVKRMSSQKDTSAARASVAHYQSAQGSTQIPSIFIPAIPERRELAGKKQPSQKILLKTGNQENL